MGEFARDLMRIVLAPVLDRLREDPDGMLAEAKERERLRRRARGSRGWRRHRRALRAAARRLRQEPDDGR